MEKRVNKVSKQFMEYDGKGLAQDYVLSRVQADMGYINLHVLVRVCVSVILFQGEGLPLSHEGGFSDVVNEGMATLLSTCYCGHSRRGGNVMEGWGVGGVKV